MLILFIRRRREVFDMMMVKHDVKHDITNHNMCYRCLQGAHLGPLPFV